MRKSITQIFLSLFLVFVLFIPPGFTETNNTPAIVENAQKSVVNITATKAYQYNYTYKGSFAFMFLFDFFEGKRLNSSQGYYYQTGAGVIIDKNGFILTNAHVVRNVDKIKITLHDRRVFYATLIGKDNKADLALLKINEAPSLYPILLARTDDIKVGQSVIAIGSPYGYRNSVTKGIISGLKREIKLSKYNKMVNLIQTDAALNPGNSGGPLINDKGEMIGINTLGGGQNLNFAISVETIQLLLPQLKNGGRDLELHNRFCQRFGFDVVENIDPKEGQVIEIDYVLEQSEAYKAGLRKKDILLQIKKDYPNDLDNLFEYAENQIAPGEKVQIKIKRNDRTFFTYLRTECLETAGKKYH